VKRPDGYAVTFAYDALGRRVRKRFRGWVTHWVWDGDKPLHEWTELEVGAGAGTASEVLTWLFEEDSFAPLAKLTKQGAQSVVCDHLGTPLTLHDGQGAVTWEMTLDSYGGVRQGNGRPQDCPFRYQGQYEDTETSLYYNRFRYFDPETGTYISQDLIGLRGGQRLYNYVANPSVWIDPFGLAGEDPFDYLNQALKQQGLKPGDPIPSGLKQTWGDVATKNIYEVRIHPADPAHGATGDIFRVSRKQPGVNTLNQGKGTEYLDNSGNWHHESTLKPGKPGQPPNPNFNSNAAAQTHIEIPAGRTVIC
jgi:RHS repeat-associated protein